MDDYFNLKAPRILRNDNLPTELPEMQEDFSKLCIHLVTLKSPLPYRRAVYTVSTYFKREGHYDFAQYGYDGHEEDPDARAFLWHEMDGWGERPKDTVIGACCFRWRVYSDAPPGWGLQWVWFHPYRRGEGHLTKAWPVFKRHFGEFEVEPPLSYAMEGFLKKINGVHQKI